ncbi:hypothetical protein Nham_2761 [Nitrobacter hamburgensis X14]|uniref:Uncharacterized protein n=1 Tax=Nitrobacter hamburgensis (strain DSM 10229 / NCIMB 13809 / X14) TaxID=323097 RepID=Q1QJQ8_NITHX|nr:hypothetical protein Nham_2761 [Nitrobacter hamburgensis X14]
MLRLTVSRSTPLRTLIPQYVPARSAQRNVLSFTSEISILIRANDTFNADIAFAPLSDRPPVMTGKQRTTSLRHHRRHNLRLVAIGVQQAPHSRSLPRPYR